MSLITDNFLQLCRLCASYQAIKMELFGREGRERNLVEKIEICLPFKVYEHDALPKSLCYRCMYLLENFYDFRKNCVNSVCLLESCVNDPEGNNVEPELRLEFEQLKSQLRHLELQREKEQHEMDDFMPHLEPQVPPASAVFSRSRRSSSEATHPSPVCSPPCLERNEESVYDFIDREPEKEPVDSDSSSLETVRIQTRRRLNHSPMHTCKICGRTFASWSQLNVHTRNHTRDEEQSESNVCQHPFTCDLCCKSYALPRHLWTHVSVAHRGDPAVTCDLCQRVCMNQARLWEHRRVCHGLEEEEPAALRRHAQALLGSVLSWPEASQHACASCGQDFPSEAELRWHSASERCVAVRRQLTEMSLLKQTLLKSRRDSAEARVRKRSFSSDTLEEPSPRKRPASSDVGAVIHCSHSGSRRKNSKPRKITRDETVSVYKEEEPRCEDQFACDVCSVTFQTADNLSNHKVVHESVEVVDANMSRDKAFTCLLCDKGFSVRQSLSRHLLSCHGIDPQEVTCTLKKQPVPSTSLEVRKPNVPCTDDEMMMEAVTLGTAAEYAEDQSSKNFFSCEVCIREFNDRSSLWLHMLYAHKEQAMYACGVCLKVCTSNGHLMMHWKEHDTVLEQRRYICQICGRQHDTRKKLVIHVGVHCLDDGKGGTFDPEAVVLQNHAFYNPEQKAKDAEGNVDANSPESKSEGQTCAEGANDSFTCEVCFKMFLSEEKLVKHKKNSHKEETSSNLYRGTYQLFFVCELCGSSHHSKSERWRHVYRCHRGEAILRCDRVSCGKVFTTRALCHEHCSNHHQLQGDIPNTCEVCGKLWGSRVDFWKHMMGVHSDLVPLTCGVCLKILCDVPELKAHVRKKHWPLVGDFCCNICGRSYSNQSKMSRHRKVHEEIVANDEIPEESTVPVKKPLQRNAAKNESKPCLPSLCCDICPEQQFASVLQLSLHRRSTHSLYPCDICTKYYGRTTHLLNHVRRKHKDEPQLICPLCSKLCSSKASVSSHIAKNHAPRDVAVKLKNKFPSFKISKGTYGQKCSTCSKTFWKRSVYRKHVRGCRNKLAADASSIQACELCDTVTFSSKAELLQHVREQHSGHPNFTCAVGDCLRVLRSSTDLELHAKMHTMDVAAATCDICGEVYDSEPKIWKHLYNSHRLRELEGLCGICLRALPTVDDLKAHVRQAHPGAYDKPNTCKLCARTYTGSYKVMLHVAKCHSSYSACKVCLEMFTDSSQLAVHMEVHEEEEEADEGDAEQSQDENSPVEQECEEHSAVNFQEKKQPVESDEVESTGKRPKRSYNCDLCTRGFLSPSLLSDHKKQFHVATASEFKPYHCSTCSKHFSNKTSYWKHINSPSHASLRKMVPSTCSHGMQKLSELVDSQDDSRPSCVSSEGFDSSRSLQEDEGPDQEIVRGQSRRRSETRKVYSADATMAGPYFCCLCGKKWPGRKHLWQHLIRNHRNEAAVTCGVCLTVCSDYHDLSRHLSVHHPQNFVGDGNNFTCRTCGRYHNARSKLLQHVLIHIVLGLGPEKQPPSLTEIMESRGAQDEGSPGSGQHDASLQSRAAHIAMSHVRRQHGELRAVEDKGFLSSHIELTCQLCDVSFDSLDELLEHQDMHHSVALQGGDIEKSDKNPSLVDDGNLLEESQDSSSHSSFNGIPSPLDSCSNEYVVGNGAADGSRDVLPVNMNCEVFGDGMDVRRELLLKAPDLDCLDSNGYKNAPQIDEKTIEKRDSYCTMDMDMIEGSYLEVQSIEHSSFEPKGCIHLGLPVRKEDGLLERIKESEDDCADDRNTEMYAREVEAAVEGICQTDCRDEIQCHLVSNGLPEEVGSPVDALVSEQSVCVAGKKVMVCRSDIAADLSADSLNSLDMLSMMQSVDI